MRLPKGWNKPTGLTEAEVVNAMRLTYEAAQVVGMPIVISAIKPSDEEPVLHAMIRGSKANPGVPSAEDATYLAARVLARVLGCYPEDARPLIRKVILEHADELVYNRKGGPIPSHMVESDYAPPIMGEDVRPA